MRIDNKINLHYIIYGKFQITYRIYRTQKYSAYY